MRPSWFPVRIADDSVRRTRPARWVLPLLAILGVLVLVAPSSGYTVTPTTSTKIAAPFTGASFTTYDGPYWRGCASASLTHPTNWSALTGRGTFGVRSAAHPCTVAHPKSANTSLGLGDLILYITVPYPKPVASIHQITVYWRVLAQISALLVPGKCLLQSGHGQYCVQEAYASVYTYIALQDTTSGATLSTGQMVQYWRAAGNTTDCTRGPCTSSSWISGRGHLGDFKATFPVLASLNTTHTYEFEVEVRGVAGSYFTTFGATLVGGHASAVFNPAKVGGVYLRSIVVS